MQFGTLWHSKAVHGLNLQASAANLHIVEILWDAVGNFYNSYGIQGLESRSGPCIFIPPMTTVSCQVFPIFFISQHVDKLKCFRLKNMYTTYVGRYSCI